MNQCLRWSLSFCHGTTRKMLHARVPMLTRRAFATARTNATLLPCCYSDAIHHSDQEWKGTAVGEGFLQSNRNPQLQPLSLVPPRHWNTNNWNTHRTTNQHLLICHLEFTATVNL